MRNQQRVEDKIRESEGVKEVERPKRLKKVGPKESTRIADRLYGYQEQYQMNLDRKRRLLEQAE